MCSTNDIKDIYKDNHIRRKKAKKNKIKIKYKFSQRKPRWYKTHPRTHLCICVYSSRCGYLVQETLILSISHLTYILVHSSVFNCNKLAHFLFLVMFVC